ncbi:hypothetical protein [Exiguobacterium sp. AM39-5BH]|uniref:hypothetical protein n=1 Tax=Exiguobacterium sp. AM39-5BH TaxID=2292355 RepID=UPI001F321242|nr:hypothetical protein [Exiguobacterium sp. AM39-5BH]
MHHTPNQQTTSHVTIERATLLSFETIRLEVITEYESVPVQIERNGRPVEYVVLNERTTETGTIERDIHLARPVTLEAVYTVFHPGHKTIVVIPREIVHTDEFERRYAYDGPLGLVFFEQTIEAYVWSPVAFSIWFVIHDPDTHREIERYVCRGKVVACGMWTFPDYMKVIIIDCMSKPQWKRMKSSILTSKPSA